MAKRKPYTIDRDRAAGWWDVVDPLGEIFARYVKRIPADDLARRMNFAHALAVKLERARARRALRGEVRKCTAALDRGERGAGGEEVERDK